MNDGCKPDILPVTATREILASTQLRKELEVGGESDADAMEEENRLLQLSTPAYQFGFR
jgi:hypothetical protein